VVTPPHPGPPTNYNIRTIHHIAVTTVLRSWRWANDCLKHVELIRRSIKLLLLHLVGHLCYSSTLMRHGQTQITSNKSHQTNQIKQIKSNKSNQTNHVKQITSNKSHQTNHIKQITSNKSHQTNHIKQIKSNKSHQINHIKQIKPNNLIYFKRRSCQNEAPLKILNTLRVAETQFVNFIWIILQFT